MDDRSDGGAKAGLSRRRFIEELAAIGGVGLAMAGMEALGFGFGSAQAAAPNLSGARKGTRIVILGAGLAGMTAAYELGKAGYDCHVVEARAFAGGRCQTARRGFSHTDLVGHSQTCDFDEELYINHGPWRIPYHHRSTLHYTKLFGVQLEVFVNDNDAAYVYFEKGKGPLAGKPVRKGQIAADARGHAAELLAKAAGKGNLDAPFSPEDRDLFIAYLVGEGWLSAKDDIYEGTEGRGWLTHPGAGIDPGPGKPSVPYALTDILQSNTWKVLTSVASYDQQRTMFQPVGGMDRIAKAFEREVGPVIRYSTEVEKIAQDWAGVEVFFKNPDGSKGSIAADYCLCTIPISVLRGIDVAVSPQFKTALDGPNYEPVNKIGLQMKRRFWEEDDGIYGGHVYTDMPGIGAISLPSTGWQGAKGVILGYYAFGAEAARISVKSPADRAAFALSAGQKVFAQYTESFETAFSFSWHLAQYNLGGWANWTPETRASAYPVLCEPDGRLYLAGEHLSYLGGWQAGAIESAWQQIAKIHARVMAA
jgi:monoamine oxidase